MKDVVEMPIKDLEYHEVFPDPPENDMEKTSLWQKTKKILFAIMGAKFFLPIIMYMSACALLFSSINYFGLRRGLRIREKNAKPMDPVKVRKREYKKRIRRHNRRIALVQLLASKKTRKSERFKRMIKIWKLYQPEKPQ